MGTSEGHAGMARGHDDQGEAGMTLIQTTLDNVPVGGTFYGKGSKDRYTKIGHTKVRPEEGPGEGDMWIMKEDSVVLIEEYKTPPSKQLVRTTFDNIPVGRTFYGSTREEKYTKISSISSRREEGFCKGHIFNWRGYKIFFVEAPQTPPSQQDEIWYDSLAAAPVKERKPWHVCFLCLHEPYGSDGPCSGCNEGSEWSPCKLMLEWHKSLNCW
jgi:hypothetical protein